MALGKERVCKGECVPQGFSVLLWERPPKVLYPDKRKMFRIYLVVRRIRLSASIAGNAGSIPGGGLKIPHVVWCGQKKKPKTKRKLLYHWLQTDKGPRRQSSRYGWQLHWKQSKGFQGHIQGYTWPLAHEAENLIDVSSSST